MRGQLKPTAPAQRPEPAQRPDPAQRPEPVQRRGRGGWRSTLAVDAGKAIRELTRAVGGGGGTSLPGLVATRIDPMLMTHLGRELPGGNLLVTGTNGKTTTTHLVAESLRQSGRAVVTNPEGSNLSRGIVTALVARARWSGCLELGDAAVGLFEVDEAVLPVAVEHLAPKLVLLANLFRDQLDRYFELDLLARLWRRALAELPGDAVVVVNVDDPQVAGLVADLPNPVVGYGLDDDRWSRPGPGHAADARRCPGCGATLQYLSTFYSHLGHYRCPGCGWERPRPDIVGSTVELEGTYSCRLGVALGTERLELSAPLGGLYNAYNLLAAAARGHTRSAWTQSTWQRRSPGPREHSHAWSASRWHTETSRHAWRW